MKNKYLEINVNGRFTKSNKKRKIYFLLDNPKGEILKSPYNPFDLRRVLIKGFENSDNNIVIDLPDRDNKDRPIAFTIYNRNDDSSRYVAMIYKYKNKISIEYSNKYEYDSKFDSMINMLYQEVDDIYNKESDKFTESLNLFIDLLKLHYKDDIVIDNDKNVYDKIINNKEEIVYI